ncbi:MAG: hypothetical protein U9N01_04445 [Euryarchaeota archaeon]|nr:hypothetical protein [Euryarchaeota archaeon]
MMKWKKLGVGVSTGLLFALIFVCVVGASDLQGNKTTEIFYGPKIYENSAKNEEVFEVLCDFDAKELINRGDDSMKDLKFDSLEDALKAAAEVEYEEDFIQYGVLDCWPNAAQVHKTQKDDCDGHAIYFASLANYFTENCSYKVTCEMFFFSDMVDLPDQGIQIPASGGDELLCHMWNKVYDEEGELVGFADATYKDIAKRGEILPPNVTESLKNYEPFLEFDDEMLIDHNLIFTHATYLKETNQKQRGENISGGTNNQ